MAFALWSSCYPIQWFNSQVHVHWCSACFILLANLNKWMFNYWKSFNLIVAKSGNAHYEQFLMLPLMFSKVVCFKCIKILLVWYRDFFMPPESPIRWASSFWSVVSVCTKKNFNLDHYFWTITGTATIFHMCIPCDMTFLSVPKFLTLRSWPLT